MMAIQAYTFQEIVGVHHKERVKDRDGELYVSKVAGTGEVVESACKAAVW
jgi:hypothetical protein